MNLYFNKTSIYKTRYFIYKYNNNYSRYVVLKNCRLSGFEEINKNKKNSSSSEETNRISLSRTKRNIREIALCNNFEYFVTFTISSNACDRYSLEECQKSLKRRFKTYKIYNKDFNYLFITEKHKDGAYHFHGLIKGLNKEDLYFNNNGYMSCRKFDKLGFHSIDYIKDYNKCCNYITKYITKECVKNSHNQIYISSRGLKKADKIEIDYLYFDKWDFENDYCYIKEIRSS